MTPLPEHLHNLVGQSVAAIDTPAAVLDLDAMERNIARMADFAREHGMRWRPHAKLHKSAAIALLLEKAGAIGHCVQKTAEAEALAKGGVGDIFISNEVVDPAKLDRMARLAARLAHRGGRLAICVDSAQGIAALAQAMRGTPGAEAGIDVFVEIDVGPGRCGVPPGAAALPLARAVLEQAPWLRFAGLQAYRGNAQHVRGVDERRAVMAEVIAQARHTRELLEQAGIAVPLVTGSGTGTLIHEAASGVRLAKVARKADGADARRGRLELAFIPAVDDDPRSLGREELGCRETEAARGSREKRALSRKTEVHAAPWPAAGKTVAMGKG